MGTARPAPLALVLVLLLFWTVIPRGAGQGPAGHLVVATDYELFGLSDLRGGGHVTWTLTGTKAADLRLKILHLFDEYRAIPKGFLYGNGGTDANQDGRLDAAEGVRYTDLVETSLEAAGRGTPAQYLQMFPFDLRDKTTDPPTSFARSTSGLAGTQANTTGDVEIRFLFQANITTRDARVPLATRTLVDALYDIFSYRAEQSPTLTRSGPYPGSWPFLDEGGWHVAAVPGSGLAALWAGNDTTGLYDNNTDASSRTLADPAYSPFDPRYEPFDFRFASRAWATLNYTGSVADSGDTLRLQYAHPPTYTDWTNLSFISGANLPSMPPGSWSNSTVDLTSLLGDRVRFRVHFVSDAAGSASGFYIRDFTVHAPAAYIGTVLETDTHYLVGTVSFSDPSVVAAGIHVIRTPGGELLTYGATWNASALPADAIYFRTFDITENPQILFGIMLIACYEISRLQERAYDRYREAHPAVYRAVLHRANWLHRAGKVAIGLLILFYFFPTALWVVGIRVVVSGPIYWFAALISTLLIGFGTKAYYTQRLEQTPPPVVGEEDPIVRKVVLPAPGSEPAPVVGHCTACLKEIREDDRTYRCTCGALYHLACASGLMRCSNCRKPIAAGVLRERKQISLRCESCGELQTVLEGTDPRAAMCANCGGRLRHLDEGKRYLIVASNPALAFAWMKDLTKGGKPALCLTPASPERLRLEFGVKEAPIVQVSSTVAGAVDPKQLDPLGLRPILPMAREGKGGVILYDGLDEIIGEASLGDVIRFLRKANDMAFVHGVTVIARVSPGRLAEPELKRLNAEFDEYLDLTAQL